MDINFEYDHTKPILNESLGIDGEILNDISTKIHLLDDNFKEGENVSTSKVIENMINLFSDEQIVVMAGVFIMDTLSKMHK